MKKELKRDEISSQVGTMGPGRMDTERLERNCSVRSCCGAAITSLDQQTLCLNHFLSRCYANLEALDPRCRKLPVEAADLAYMREFIEECSRKALDVSLHSETLTNLQRGRLLDILLWAGELFLLLRAQRLTLAQAMASAEVQLASRAASQKF
jgi:hypothetical protein